MTYSKSVAVWLSEGQITCVRNNSFLLHLRKVCLNSQLGIGLGQICPEKREPSPTDAVALAPVSKEHCTGRLAEPSRPHSNATSALHCSNLTGFTPASVRSTPFTSQMVVACWFSKPLCATYLAAIITLPDTLLKLTSPDKYC